MKRILCIILTMLVSLAASAEEVLKMEGTRIRGNQELPKVLYILPWQQPGGVPEFEMQAQFARKNLFRRLYPPAYRRELAYYELLNGFEVKE